MFPLEHADDTRAALTFLENQPRVDAQRLGLLGWSYGAGLVPYVAAVDRRVRCAISAVGAGDWGQQQRSTRRHWEWLSLLDRIAEDRRSRVLTGKPIPTLPGDLAAMSPTADAYRARFMKSIPHMADYKGAPSTLESLERMIEFKPVEFVGQIRNCPMLYIGAERDTVTIGDQVIAMYERTNGPKQLWMIPGIDHYGVYEEPYVGQVLAECFGWLQKHLVKAAA
jgi:dipeptidyl aminopeptidase/acylaminoacyl peptidase